MGIVVNIGDYKKRGMVGAIRELFVQCSRGRVRGFVFSVEFTDGSQKSGFMGLYETDRSEVTNAATRMRRILDQVADKDASARALRE